MSKPVVIPNWKYQKPSKGGHRGLKKLLKYVSYRESPDHNPVEQDERWTDCGLGDSWRDVYQNCAALANQYVLAHHLVIAPDPALMALVPEGQKHELVRELTERVVDGWHAARGLPVAEYSYVLHDRDTSDYGLQNLHTHIFIAGTFENEAGERESRRVDRQQVCADRGGPEREDNLHHIARREFEQLLDRTLGPAWRIERERQLQLEAVQEATIEDDLEPTVRKTPDLELDL
ncbi:MAG: hypothetical protein GX573_09890 [Chloroflexi bacterium]|nr:hypothetical protein [Chloroflexota bacterium]